MSAKKFESDRRRSRPITKHKKTDKLKRNKPAMVLVIIIVAMLVFSSVYVIFSNLGDSNDTEAEGYESDPEYINALAGTDYPVAVINTSKGVTAVELYDDKLPVTCDNFIRLVKDEFYDGMIFHRISDDFMIQAGRYYPDGSQSQSPYGNIVFESDNDVTHVDGAISMASTGAGVGGSAEFFIMDGARVGSQAGLDGNYAAFGKVIYNIEVVRDIADDDHDGSSEPNPGGGKPYNDILINSIKMVKE